MICRDVTRRWPAEKLKTHPYFEGIDWEMLEAGYYKRASITVAARAHADTSLYSRLPPRAPRACRSADCVPLRLLPPRVDPLRPHILPQFPLDIIKPLLAQHQ